MAVGEPITASWEVANAPEGSYTHASWIVFNTNVSSGEQNDVRKTSATFIPKYGISGFVSVSLLDANDALIMSQDSSSFTITGADPVSPNPVLPAEATIQLSLNKESVAVGDSITASYQLVGAPEGWTLVAFWNIIDMDGKYHTVKTDFAQTSSSITVKFGAKGDLTLVPSHPDATPASDRSVSRDFTITGGVETPELSLSLSKSTGSVAVGSPISFSWQAQGGTAPYTYEYGWSLEEGQEYLDGDWIENSTETSFSLTPQGGTTGYFSVDVTDAVGRTVHESFLFEVVKGETPTDPEAPEAQDPVLPEGAYVEVSLDRTSLAVGETITATYRLVNAPEEWTVAAGWEVTEESGETHLVHVDQFQNASSFTPKFGVKGRLIIEPQHPKAEGPYHAGMVYRNFTIIGGVEAPAISLSLEASTPKATIGSPISFNWQAQGGTAPYTYSYGWHIDEVQESWYGEQVDETTLTSLSITPKPTSAALGHIWVKVTDAVGRNTVQSIDFEVVKAAVTESPATATPKPAATASPKPSTAPTTAPVTQPPVRPTTKPVTPVQQPAAPVTQPQGTPVEELAKSVVVDDLSRDLPFVISTTQSEAGQKTLVIAATQSKEILDNKKDVKWILSPELIQAASQQGLGQISAQREGISVIVDVENLLKSGNLETQVSIQAVETTTLPDEVQKQVKDQALSDVYQVSVSTAKPGELVHVRFAADDTLDNAAIMVIRADGSLVLYPEVTITVDAQGNRSVDVMVENGAMCYLVKR